CRDGVNGIAGSVKTKDGTTPVGRDRQARTRRRANRRLRSRKHNPDGTMSLRDHLREFRNRVGFALLFLLGGGTFGFIWYGIDLGVIPSLSDIVLRPYCQLDLPRGPNGQCQLLQTGPRGRSSWQ